MWCLRSGEWRTIRFRTHIYNTILDVLKARGWVDVSTYVVAPCAPTTCTHQLTHAAWAAQRR
jgi:hypothetical protein